MSGAETTAEAADVSEGDSAWNGGGDRSGSGRSLQLCVKERAQGTEVGRTPTN